MVRAKFLIEEPVFAKLEVEKLEACFLLLEPLLLGGRGEDGPGRAVSEVEVWIGSSSEGEGSFDSERRDFAFDPLWRAEAKRKMPLGERGGSGVVDTEPPTTDD